MTLIEHPAFPGKRGRWNVYVTAHRVRGCTGSYRWRWRAQFRAHSMRRYWPGDKFVEIRYEQGQEMTKCD